MRKNTFIGVDLGWYGKPTGLASIEFEGGRLRSAGIGRVEGHDAVVAWVAEHAGPDAVVAIDAPTIICNATGIRPAERGLNADFRRFHAGCHAANLDRPFAAKVLAFSRRLEELGFRLQADMQARASGRYQIEVHPHAATVALFDLPQIVKYKRGIRAVRAAGLRRLRRLLTTRLPGLEPALDPELPPVPVRGNLKVAEDQIDAVTCAYVAAHWWYWGLERNTVYGDVATGFIVVPGRKRTG